MANKDTLGYISRIAGRTKYCILFLTVIQILLGVSTILYALALKIIINAASAGDMGRFRLAITEFTALFLAQITLKALNRRLDEYTRSTLENRFKERLFSMLLSSDFSAVSSVHSGEWMNRLTSDTSVIANDLTGIIPGVTGMAVRLVGAAVMIILLEPRSCFLILPGGILLLILSTLFRKRIKKLHKNVQEKDGKLRVYLHDILGSMLMVRSFAIEDDVLEAAGEKMAVHRSARMKKNAFSNICNIGFGIIMNGAYVAGAVYCGWGILTGSMDHGNFMAVIQLIGQVQSPFANISGFLPRWYAMLASAERIMEAENFTARSSSAAMPLEEVLGHYSTDLQCIGLDRADFTYRSPDPETDIPLVLKDISLTINKGDYIAFTGQSGCGKSTVMKLLLSLYELDGGDRFVVCGGEKQPLGAKWQRLFAYVPQGDHLMSGTVREIVSLADKSRSSDDSAILSALKSACAEDFAAELENGIDTPIGEGGQGLSEGQMQRIAVARALFSGRPVLLLDESTSALDEMTEKKLLANLRSMTDKTVIIVTHRPAALEICDRIIEFTESGLKEVKK